jgi:hypothetical protein
VRALLILFLLVSTSPRAQAPIPKLLEDGKRVYMVNAAANQEHFDDLARYLAAWGGFTLVNERADADLVLTFAASTSGRTAAGRSCVTSTVAARA